MDAVSQYDIDAMMSDMMRYRDDNRTRSASQSPPPPAAEESYDGQDWQPPFWQAQQETASRQTPPKMPSTPMPSEMPPSEMRGMSDCIDSLPLAMAYVPMQRWGKTYEPDVALARGTLFPDLDKPFLAAGV